MVFADDVPSAVVREECEALGALARNKVVLELGAHYGRSTIALASVAQRVVSVDWHRGDVHAGHEDSVIPYFQNLERYGMRDRVVTIVARFEHALPLLRGATFDLAFIDGCHDYEAVLRDTVFVLPLMIGMGAVFAYHDYSPHFGVQRFVDHTVAETGAPLSVVRTLAWLSPIRAGVR